MRPSATAQQAGSGVVHLPLSPSISLYLGVVHQPRYYGFSSTSRCNHKQSEVQSEASTSSATGVSSTSRARRRGPATSVPPPKLYTREIEREIE